MEPQVPKMRVARDFRDLLRAAAMMEHGLDHKRALPVPWDRVKAAGGHPPAAKDNRFPRMVRRAGKGRSSQ